MLQKGMLRAGQQGGPKGLFKIVQRICKWMSTPSPGLFSHWQIAVWDALLWKQVSAINKCHTLVATYRTSL